MSGFEVRVSEPPALDVAVVGEPNPRVEVRVTDVPPEVVEVLVPGPAGPPGPKGDPGSVAPGSGDAHYVHVQSVPDRVWTVAHGMGKHPSVTVVDSANTEVEGDVAYLDASSLTITHAAPFSGTAYLN